MLVATALVLFMTIPGLALFYGGMVRKKNVLATLMQSFAICCAVTVVWIVIGYSLAFAPGNGFVGGLSKVMLSGVKVDTLWGTIPEMLFMVFQMTFAIITPALITGAFAERMKFSAMLLFSVLWSIVVYSPICHWVWESGGWLFAKGALDFAGGTVVHINAGVAGLVAALVLGKRVGFGKEAMPPHNLVLTLIGASMLWVGWFGFNAGSELAADGRAAMAMVATQVAAAGAALAWIFAEWLAKGKPSVLGIASGAVAGLVAITPASGFVGPGAALALGLIAGVVCYWGATSLKHMIGYDDSLDAFGVHGVGGILGAILTGVFASSEITGTKLPSVGEQVWIQLEATVATAAYTLVVTFILLKLIDLVIGLRVEPDEEREGLDIVLHGEHVE
ncbi:ammonium transporter [Leeia sp. TBRC 13508]|uniref:Ammonium transporter n=2 Tax=Leeia speluncae TaxID=2884804 RepID=A0ABS8D3T3_9NEIS|nr:ammonium transporter [Leeia speluncae]